MIFNHDAEHALGVVVDLVNTSPAACGREGLGDLEALRAFVERNRFSDVSGLARADLERAHALRGRFHEVFLTTRTATAVALVNEVVAEVRATPRLTDHDGHDWHVHFFAPGAPMGEHLAAEGGMALAFVVAAGELERLRTCAAPGCARVLVDLSRNRCRRYCDTRTCGNRMHVAAYRARRRETAP
ncbi:CGNR zinc finger domain-containing protein [Actinomadura parmotrematis]|uniref:CGNR zinc finger domain-containing protein n=1 Tax=Actinomadura parmotrematis TaxID=2864039 RepID=A0ABS7G3Z8_9ACTN|nr:CGNR zinc finger domain-containing protein [Actinomadura parmotrematis]MBW8487090.1 CGNR zinc finger domain-containing protein [Actinomadura parmotrematis]